MYDIELKKANGRSFSSGQFRVEEFRLPLMEGRVNTTGKQALVNPKAVPVDVQINYLAGGPAANLPVRLSAHLRSHYLQFPEHAGFSFQQPQGLAQTPLSDESDDEVHEGYAVLIADKIPLRLDKNGTAKTNITGALQNKVPKELLLEASYADPNGEVQTIRQTRTVWPAAVLAGIKTEDWLSSGQQIKFQALALDLSGKPQEGVPLEVRATARTVTSTRKRMVGGFYTYDNQSSVKDLGRVCAGKSDSRGLLLCETTLSESGEVELVVTAQDASGNSIQAASSVYVTRQGELWFGGDDHDRIDLLPEKKIMNRVKQPSFKCACRSDWQPRW
jgi:uncharacterized protein YfaS (alpha-2-macroglobulin family)